MLIVCAYCREDGDQKRAISYASAFSSSKLPSQIIKWIASQVGMDEKASISIGSSPKALLSKQLLMPFTSCLYLVGYNNLFSPILSCNWSIS